MTETMQVNAGLERIRRWSDDYRNGMNPSPLEDVSQLSAQLDMTHAHPSGIAQLFASGRVLLEALFRDAGMLRAAGRRLERVLDDQAAKRRITGVAELSLIVGIASWKGNAMPVLIYPVSVSRKEHGRETDATIRFTGHVGLNQNFVAAMREQGITLKEQELFDGSRYESGTPETSAVFKAIIEQGREAFPDFDIERDIILGCFIDPASQILLESRTLVDRLQHGPSDNTVLDALVGYGPALETLKGETLEEYSPFDGDPHGEFEVGDVDNSVRYAAAMAAEGHNLFVDAAAGSDTAAQSAAIASRCMMNGRSVLYVPCIAQQRRRFMTVMSANELSGQVLDVADVHAGTGLDRQLIEAVGFQPGVDSARYDQLSDELVGVRSRLTRYLGDLHGVNAQWGVSAYQTMQNLATIAATPTHPATHVRLSDSTAHALIGHLDEWVDKLKKAGELGEYVVGPEDTAWYHASISSEQEAVRSYQRVVDVLRKLLPATREQVALTVKTCGFPIPTTVQEWGRQVIVLRNLRRVLDVFQPEIFERDLDAMIEASKPKAERKAEGTSMGFWERRRHVKEAKSLLRVGAQVEDLHEALKVVAKQGEQWRVFVPHGGWPVLPAKLDAILATQESLVDNITALDTVLATTPHGDGLEALDFNTLELRLKALYDDHLALDTVPGRFRLEQEFRSAGLEELLDDLRNRHVDIDAVEGELHLSWWTTVFDDIVRSSAIISNQDGSAMQAAADRFAQVDVEHVRSIGPMLRQEAMRHLSDLLFSRTQEANQLHTALAGSSRIALNRIARDHPQILKAAKPIVVATPSTLAALTDPQPLCDVAIIDAGAHLPAIQLLSIVSRARQVVIIAHRNTVTSDSVDALIGLLPRVETAGTPSARCPGLNAFLTSHGYGELANDVAVESMQGTVRMHHVEATGAPVLTTGLVESSQQEIDAVIAIITDRAKQFTVVPSGYMLTVVTLTAVFRTRLGAELKSLATRHAAMGKFLRHVRLIGINEVAGARGDDAILSLCYAKTSHGRLLQQFGHLETAGGKGMLLDALALARHNVDIVAAFGSEDMDDDRLHQPGTRLLKALLQWAEAADDDRDRRPAADATSENVLFNDIADRVRARGLEAAVNYGFDDGLHVPLVVGLKDKPFALAVFTDDAPLMGIQSTRCRHRLLLEHMEVLGWSVMSVWSVGAFVNPDKEVDRIVDRISEIYRGVQ